ncbi:MAG TPA: cyclic nucleotide-binding domain-containing protein [Bacteroidia bacterium]|nr:cyclic nucleotide-binding domain-containing protein [Bacteroidia bacterium]
MDESALVEVLRGNADFDGVGDGSLAELVRAGETSRPEPGAEIIRQGEVSARVWILVEGELEISVGGEMVNRIARAGEVVGQISAVSLVPATASVRIAAPSTCLSVPVPELHRLFAGHPDLAEAMLRSMVKYLGAR